MIASETIVPVSAFTEACVEKSLYSETIIAPSLFTVADTGFIPQSAITSRLFLFDSLSQLLFDDGTQVEN